MAILIYAKPQDISLYKLKDLYDKGYRYVRWINTESACKVCIDLDNKIWPIETFIHEWGHTAPFFDHSHVSCRCLLEVTGYKDDYLEPVIIDAY